MDAEKLTEASDAGGDAGNSPISEYVAGLTEGLCRHCQVDADVIATRRHDCTRAVATAVCSGRWSQADGSSRRANGFVPGPPDGFYPGAGALPRGGSVPWLGTRRGYLPLAQHIGQSRLLEATAAAMEVAQLAEKSGLDTEDGKLAETAKADVETGILAEASIADMVDGQLAEEAGPDAEAGRLDETSGAGAVAGKLAEALIADRKAGQPEEESGLGMDAGKPGEAPGAEVEVDELVEASVAGMDVGS